jgi:hypothetical protein
MSQGPFALGGAIFDPAVVCCAIAKAGPIMVNNSASIATKLVLVFMDILKFAVPNEFQDFEVLVISDVVERKQCKRFLGQGLAGLCVLKHYRKPILNFFVFINLGLIGN